MTSLVMIGTSAGGVPALMQLTAALPPDFAAPLLIVLHVGARNSVLPTILGRVCPMPVKHAQDDEPLLPGHVYVAPPDHHLLVDDYRMRLTRGPKENHCRPAIDPLFRSGALAAGVDAVGVVLTGMLDDGTAGLQAIKRCGGIAVVQDPDEAYEPSMPLSALRHVEVDHCVSMAIMPLLLCTLVAGRRGGARPDGTEAVVHEHQLTLNTERRMEHLRAIGKPSTYTCPECHGDLWEVLDSRPTRFRCHTGHGFTTRALQQALAESGEQSVWNAMRALEERQMLLEQMATQHRAVGDEDEAARLESVAMRLREQVRTMRSLVELELPPVE